MPTVEEKPHDTRLYAKVIQHDDGLWELTPLPLEDVQSTRGPTTITIPGARSVLKAQIDDTVNQNIQTLAPDAMFHIALATYAVLVNKANRTNRENNQLQRCLTLFAHVRRVYLSGEKHKREVDTFTTFDQVAAYEIPGHADDWNETS
jgi:hypothetical protein